MEVEVGQILSHSQLRKAKRSKREMKNQMGNQEKGSYLGIKKIPKKQGQEFSQKSNGDQGDRKEKKKKRHRDKTEYSYESGSESSSGSESESEPAPPGVDDDEPLPPGVEPGSAGEKTEKSPKKEPKTSTSKEPGEDDEDGEDKDAETKPRALHQTLSIFLRNLAPTITKQEVEAMCKRYPGFIRTALQDPQPERRWSRRGWVTFDKSVNIKDICWNLNNIRLRDCEMGAIVNRDIKQRIRPMNGITTHPKVAQQDIKNAAKIIQNFDTKWRIWEDGDDKKEEEKESFGLVSKNPVLKNITDYLVEEGSYEEEELLGEALEEKKDEKNGEEASERDEKMMQVLDRMLLYLRIVYSVDYYSGAEYPQEDDMPHRVGIMHSRLITHPKLTLQDVTDWMNNFRMRIKQFLDMKDKIDDEEATKLGRKDPDAEVEKFIVANTQELAKDKWLCPLSGKKFKGPDFVRKHIFNKHGEKIDEVKIEVAFFNNYLMDPKRVQLPEHPANKQGGGMPSGVNRGGDFNMPPGGYQGPPQQGMMGYNQPRPQMMGGNYQGGHPQFNSPPYHQGREEPFRRDNYNRPRGLQSRSSRSRQDPRGIIEYRDLDAPDDMDIF